MSSNSPEFPKVLELLKQSNCIPMEEWEWLWKQREQTSIKICWDPLTQNSGMDFSSQIAYNRTIAFGPYYALYPIGCGSFSIVYKAWEIGTRNIVALKQLLPEYASGCSLERFQREIEVWQSLQHPHILPLLAGGCQDDQYFLVTQFIQGKNLEQLMHELPRQRNSDQLGPLFASILQIAKALAYAHEQGIIHRDIKPANIMVQGMNAYLMDFGMARRIEPDIRITWGAVGTPCYMAPELWQKQASPQSDIYSLCVILYEMVAGQCPFIGLDPEDILVKQLCSRPKPPVQPQSRLPLELNAFILKGLALLPSHRYASMQEFRETLMRILGCQMTSAR